jgi:hypothetical protein
MDGTVLNDAIYTRNATIIEKYGVELEEIASGNLTFREQVANRISTGDTSYQVLYMGLADAAYASQSGYLQDMTEMENIRKLMKDPKYGSGMLGTVFFRSGTFVYAKATYDTVNKIITVKIDNTGSSAYTQVRVEAKNGIKFTDASIGDGINESSTVTLPSSGSNVTFKRSNLLPAGKEGYLYLKYEGEIDPAKLPVLIRMYTSSGESRVYTVFCDTSADNADIGEPIFTKPEESTAEAAKVATTEAEVTTAEQIETTPIDTEPTKSGCGGFAHSGIAIAAMGAGAVVLKKKKKK